MPQSLSAISRGKKKFVSNCINTATTQVTQTFCQIRNLCFRLVRNWQDRDKGPNQSTGGPLCHKQSKECIWPLIAEGAADAA